MKNTREIKQNVNNILTDFYWKTFGKKIINEIVKEKLNEPPTDMSGIMVGELRKDGGYFNALIPFVKLYS